MPRVHHVKAARKDQPHCNVKAGESYYWWKNRLPGRAAGYKRCSKTMPRRSQITMGFAGEIAGLEEMIEDDTKVMPISLEDALQMRDTWAESIRDLASEQEEKYNNMPEGLQQGPTGELLEERQYCLEGWADELEAVEIGEPEEEDDEDEEAVTRVIEEFFYELDQIACQCS